MAKQEKQQPLSEAEGRIAAVGDVQQADQTTSTSKTTLGKLKSKGDVTSLTKDLRETLGEEATATVYMPVAEYNALAESSAKLAEDGEYTNLSAQTAEGGPGITIKENGITLKVLPKF